MHAKDFENTRRRYKWS